MPETPNGSGITRPPLLFAAARLDAVLGALCAKTIVPIRS